MSELSLSISQAAETCGVTAKCIRYCEQIGLIPKAARHNGAARTGGNGLHGEDDLPWLRFIRNSRALGLGLADIADLLSPSEGKGCLGARPRYRACGTTAPANIVEAAGGKVHGVLYPLPLHKFARLDNSEGKQYDYLWTDIADDAGRRVPAVTYKVPHAVPEGEPGRRYVAVIREAARQRGLPAEYIAALDRVETRE